MYTTHRRNAGSLRHTFAWVSIICLLPHFALAGSVQSGPDFSKVFQPATIGPGSTSTLVFTIDDSTTQTGPVSSLAFTDTLPAGVTIASPAQALSLCGGSLTAPAGGGTITFSGGTLGVGAACSISVDVTSSTAGTHSNFTGSLTSNVGTGGFANADLTVSTALPGFTKSFAPASVSFGGRSALTFTIDNTANTAQAIFLAFTDNLPTGMVVANPANIANTCAGGVVSGAPGTSVISLASAGVVAASSTCTVVIDIIGGAVGTLGNTSGELTSTVGFSNASSGKASAELTVTGGASEPILLGKDFIDDPVLPGGTTTLQFTINNTDRNNAATAIAFSDDLGAVLTGLAATGLPASNVCGTGSALSGTGVVSLTGGNLAPESSCTFSVAVAVPPGAVPGTYTNTTSTITGTIAGSGVSGSAATDLLFVETFPLLSKSFSDDPVGPGGTVTLQFAISNPSTTSALNNIAFTDELTTFLPFPVTVTLPPSPNPPCGAGSAMTLASLGFERQGLSLTGGSLAANASCTFSVPVDIPVGFPGGNYLNTTSAISSDVGTGPAASDTLAVISAPSLSKSFTDDPALPGGTVTLQFTLGHDALATGNATAISFTDDLDAALTGLVATGLPLNNICGSGSSISGTNLLTFTAGTLAPGANCSFNVTLTVPAGATPGAHTNTTSDVTASVSGVTATNNPASDDLLITGLSLSKQFTDDPAIPSGTVNLRFTLDNSNGTSNATLITFTDDLNSVLPGTPDLSVATLPASPCGGSLTDTFGLLGFTGGSVTAGNSCSFDVSVQVPAGAANGSFNNVTSVLNATIGGTPLVLQFATDVLVVNDNLLDLSKSFTDDPAVPGGNVTLEFTLNNLDLTGAASAVAFTDDLGAALTGLTISAVSLDTCGGTPMGTGSSLFSYTGGSLAAAGSCTIRTTLNVPTGPLSGNAFTNTTSAVSGMINALPVSGDPASDTLQVFALKLSSSFAGVGFAGQPVTLNFSIDNLDASSGASGLSFTDTLPAGLVASGLPASNICGTGSSLAGTTLLTFTGGTLGGGGSCTFPVTLQIPSAATPGTVVNNSSDLLKSGLTVAAASTASLVIEPPPSFAKAFTPATVASGQTSTLTFSIDNSASTVAATSLAFADNLPAGLLVATPPNGSSSCTGGTLSAVASTNSVSYSGGSVAAGGTCAVQVDTVASLVGNLVNTSGDLTSSSGNSGPATASLNVGEDSDGVPGSIEDMGPNGGDANMDGIPDRTQDNVATLPIFNGTSFMTLVVSGGCATLTNVAAVNPNSTGKLDSGFSHPFGLVGFDLPCENAVVSVTYHGSTGFSGATYRKFGPVTPGVPASADWYDFSAFASATGNVWTLSLADDRLGDDTGNDGFIVDQGGPAMAVVAVPAVRWPMLLLLAALLGLIGSVVASRSARRAF